MVAIHFPCKKTPCEGFFIELPKFSRLNPLAKEDRVEWSRFSLTVLSLPPSLPLLSLSHKLPSSTLCSALRIYKKQPYLSLFSTRLPRILHARPEHSPYNRNLRDSLWNELGFRINQGWGSDNGFLHLLALSQYPFSLTLKRLSFSSYSEMRRSSETESHWSIFAGADLLRFHWTRGLV